MSALKISDRSDFRSLPEIYAPSAGAGNFSNILPGRLLAMGVPTPSLARSTSTNGERNRSLIERLFDNSAVLKSLVSQVSMHMPDNWRQIIFRKLDHILSWENWEDSDSLIDPRSFMTFLRFILQTGPLRGMGLGVSEDGHLLAGWINGNGQLSLEFGTNDDIRWAIVRDAGQYPESAAGRTMRERLLAVLQPYAPDAWFGNAT
jgi:hypothetical protein